MGNANTATSNLKNPAAMISPSTSSIPIALTLTDLENLQLGQQYVAPGCVPAVTGMGAGSAYAYAVNDGFSWPNNGEFTWTGDGPINGCQYCDLTPGLDNKYGCPPAQGGVWGTSPAITRVAYTGDVTACCLGNGALTQGTGTCDPNLLGGPAATACSNVFASYCAQGDNSMTDARCKTWGASNTTNGTTLYNLQKAVCASNPDSNCANVLTAQDYTTLLSNYLTANPSALNSSEWRNQAFMYPGSANLVISTYCAEGNADANFCSCINAANAVNGAFPPACINSICSTSGYKTSNSANNCTGNYTICESNINATAMANIKLEHVTIDQTCGNTATTTTAPSYVQKSAGVTATTTAASAAPAASSTTSSSNMTLFIIIFIVVIIIASATYVVFFDSSMLDDLNADF